ncbi:hypothetical protein [Streptomyces chumphonensis]|uniref:hypothetical protein n=1 Tax=Streptomyces chumphonensis TaxID=1214925 RepID=UPI003D705C60
MTATGHGLLVAGDGAHGGMAALAGAAPAALLGTPAGGSIVQLAAPLDPAGVLTALRTAAAHPGPLLVALSGAVLLDRRQGRPHLALSRTTARTVRYDGLPWAWLAAETRGRAQPVTVAVDVTAGEDVLAAVEADPELLGVPGAAVVGVVCGPRRARAAGGYLTALGAVLRGGGGPVLAAHGQAVVRAGLDGRSGVAVLRASAPVRATGSGGPAPAAAAGARGPVPPDTEPHRAIYAALHDGRYSVAVAMASAWEQAALRAHGARSAEAVHWVEVRADLAYRAGRWADAARGWLHAATARLDAGTAPHDVHVRAAVDRAHHCWHRTGDHDQDHEELGAALAEVRRRVPGPPGARADVRARLALAGVG